MPKTITENKTFMIFTNVDSHFYHHLLPIAKQAQKRGYKVQVLTNLDKLEAEVKKFGYETLNFSFSRKSVNPIKALKEIYQLYKTLKAAKPDVLMAFTIKPIFFSTIATILLRKIKLFNNFVGLGLLFTDNSPKYRIMRFVVSVILKIASFGRKITYITQNNEDKSELINSNISSEDNNIALCSVGVDLEHFKPTPLPKSKTITFALISRMLIDKGVIEFIEAAKIVRSEGYDARFLLVGAPDDDNPKSLSKEFLENLNKEGVVEYLGQTEDVRNIWDIAHVAVLPSYREGMSRVLLEAGAIGRAIITTSNSGGLDLINDGHDGLLIPIKNSSELAEKIKILSKDRPFLTKLASNISKKISNTYEHQAIAGKVIDLISQD